MNSFKCVVTGGGGFVGKALCKRLREAGHEVYSIARSAYPELDHLGVKSVRLDLSQTKPAELAQVLRGSAVVFHVAAKVEMWGKYEDFYCGNVLATQNVIEACRLAGVKDLVFTSSPSVVASSQDLCGVDESVPYPEHFDAFYPQTKAQAEYLVLQANSPGLRTVALRPKLIFGPGDTNLIPAILEKAKSGKLKIIGSGKNLSDFCYIEDCVEAHLLAWQALENNPNCRGKAYFVSQGEPTNLWEWINEVLRRSGLKPITQVVSERVARVVAYFAEICSKYFAPHKEPFLTRFLVSEMCKHHYFDISAARRDLGFTPRYSIRAALDLTYSCMPPNSLSQR